MNRVNYTKSHPESIFRFNNSIVTAYLARCCCYVLCHLRELKFCHNFVDSQDPAYESGKDTESTIKHYRVH